MEVPLPRNGENRIREKKQISEDTTIAGALLFHSRIEAGIIAQQRIDRIACTNLRPLEAAQNRPTIEMIVSGHPSPHLPIWINW
tara:strand:+ start:211 stop:462 length:252 start_codon:yes stop_codon:yes gene_type:complete